MIVCKVKVSRDRGIVLLLNAIMKQMSSDLFLFSGLRLTEIKQPNLY